MPKPIPDRGPPNRAPSQQSSHLGTLSTTQSALPLTSRGKVALKPGHSPLDWARLCNSEDLRGVSGFMRITPSELAKHARRSQGVWMALGGRVYNCSRYIDFHPGGAGQLLRGAGKDATQLFMETHGWVNFEGMLEKCLIGILVPEPEPV
ncbi:hypothetical protein BCR37DRAFT_349849 [Protomyces lactucae-debilis]|uniref:Cytochrome b5 heme-binding domain-containing protein n=1 Tax=Protomyces lactucae-debilis TaxID=2754530 RepID=A0A1Y2F7X5_PROLT|nr:uncharacterized protein BCR37DRAFT_349849 [Protomyces lactucae-debilis]ORY79466.1 hypothetical protein BCR37DRAFT_349849 [Protomyces lactucae-debilis]